MDRFIVIADVAEDESVLRLKSNMDRFIVWRAVELYYILSV